MSTSLTLVSDFYEGRYNLIIYVGIAIAKLNHFASAISSDGKELMKPFKFTNGGDGFQMLQSRLVELSCSGDSIIIVLESTAHYSDNASLLVPAQDSLPVVWLAPCRMGFPPIKYHALAGRTDFS